MPEPDPCVLVVFGASGDLTTTKLVPALWALHREGALHPDTCILGFARSDLGDDGFRQRVDDALPDPDGAEDRGAFRARFGYVRGDYDDAAAYRRLAERLEACPPPNRLFYTATPPATYEAIVAGLAGADLARAPDGWARLVIEKPFGHDEASARELNARLGEAFREEQIYRIDHYLAKETAQNIAVLRFANRLFSPVWSAEAIDHVQITMAEDGGVAGRAGYYEAAGPIRDVFQNHLLQLLALVAMEPPARWDAQAVRDEKVKVFRAAACPDPQRAVFGQYTAAEGLAGYREEAGVAPDSVQATFAAVTFEIRNARWAGVPFYVRSGKRMGTKTTEIVLTLRRPGHVPFELPTPPAADQLILRISPLEGIRIAFNAKRPGGRPELDRVGLDFHYARHFGRPNPDAYETLLLDAIEGDATLFMRADEVEAQWRVVAPLLPHADGADAPHPYPAGRPGPAQAEALLARDGRRWHAPGEDLPIGDAASDA